MKQTKLWSVLLALTLLCGCVLGILFTGTFAEETVVLYAVGDLEVDGALHADSIQDALAELEKNSRKWPANTTAEIRIQGTDHSGGAQDGVLFGQATIWREDGTKLPITIRGVDKTSPRDAYIYLDGAGGWYACANDYTFINLILPVADQETFFFAGSGNVTFIDCATGNSGAVTVQTVQDRTDTYLNTRAAAIAICEDLKDEIIPELNRLPNGDAWQAVRNSAEYHATGTVKTDTNGDAYVDKDLTGKNGNAYGDYSHAGDTGGGQYLNACVYYEAIFGMECKDNPWRPTKYQLDESLVPILQKAAHDAVVEVYGEDHFKTPIDADINDDNVVNLLMVGSSSSYYMRDELHFMANEVGIKLRVVHAYSSGIKMSTQWSWAKNGTGKWTVYTEWDGTTSSGVQNQKLADFINQQPWDVIVTYQTGGSFNKKNLGGGYSDETVAKALEGCTYADEFINFMYEYNNNSNANARYFWFQTVGAPVGAPGPSSDSKGYYFGDNCTDAVYAGWTKADLERYSVDGKVYSSLTLGDGMEYNSYISPVGYLKDSAPAETYTDATAAAVEFIAGSGFEGYDIPEVRPVDTLGILVIDGATVGNPRLHLGHSPASAELRVKKGSTGSITLCNKNTVTRYGDATVRITGGTVEQLDLLYYSTMIGDLKVYMDESDGEALITAMLRVGFSSNSVDGDIIVDVRGGTVTGTVYSGGNATGTVYNSFSDCTLLASFFGVRVGTPNRVVNTFKNVNIGKNYYGGNYASGAIKVVENYLDNVVIEGNYGGGTYDDSTTSNPGADVTIDGKTEKLAIYNSIKNCTVKGIYYGAGNAAKNGNVRNDIWNSTFNGNFFGANYGENGSSTVGNVTNNIYSATFNGTYFGGTEGNKSGVKIGDIVNNITTATFNGEYYGGNTLRTANSVTNNISGGTFKLGFTGGDKSGPITNGITNNIKGGTFEGQVLCGSFYSVGTDIVNNISGGTFKGAFYGGNNSHEISSITNNISGGTFENPTAKNSKDASVSLYAFHAGSISGAVKKDINNNISGGTFARHVILGNISTVGGDIVNTISGGEFALTSCGAGKGTVSGSVYNTISGTANFKKGFYCGYSLKESSATVVQGNMINRVEQGPQSDRPYFGRAPAYLLSKDGTADSYYDIGNSDYGYMGGSSSGTVNGYIQNTFNGGYYYGHLHGGHGAGSVNGVAENGYSIINYFTAGTYAYRVYGGVMSSPVLKGGVYNEISGGWFKNTFAAGHRAAKESLTNDSYSDPITTYIYGDPVFDQSIYGVGRGWNADQSARIRIVAPMTLTIEGGTFKTNVYGICNHGQVTDEAAEVNRNIGARIEEGGSVTVNIYGGTIHGDVIAASQNYVADLYKGYATLNIAPTKGDITILGSVKARFSKEIFNLGGGTYKLKLGESSSVKASSFDGKTLVVEQTENWKSGTTYLTLPASANTDMVIATQKAEITTIAKKNATETQVTWVGGTGEANNVYGANLILNSKIELRVWLNKAEVDAVGAGFAFAITREGFDKAILSGTYADLQAKAEILTAKIDGVDTEFYTLVLPGTAPSEYEKKYSISATGMNVTELCMNDLLRIVIDDQSGQFTDGFKTLAKALWNYGIEGYDRFSGKASALTPETLSAPTAAAIVASGKAGVSEKITLVGKALVLREAIGIRYYLNLAEGTSAEDLTVSMNGEALAVNLINFAEEEGAGYNASITLYVAAGSMDLPLTVDFTAPDGDAGSYTESITSLCQQYVNAGRADAKLCTAILRYAQAVPEMNS